MSHDVFRACLKAGGAMKRHVLRVGGKYLRRQGNPPTPPPAIPRDIPHPPFLSPSRLSRPWENRTGRNGQGESGAERMVDMIEWKEGETSDD